MIFFGVDPGKTGAIAGIDVDGAFVDALVLDTADATSVRLFLRSLRVSSTIVRVVGIERVGAFPGAGVAGMFRFGASWGVPLGVAVGLGYRIAHVVPQRWTRLAFDGRTKPPEKRDRKRAVLVAARERWPDAPLSRVADGAIAEALWIAETARRAELGFEKGAPK